MSATQGYNQVLKIEDPDNPGTYIDVSCNLTDMTVNLNGDTIDVTTFCTDGWRESIMGLKQLGLNISYVVDSTLRSLLWKLFNASAPFGVQHYPEGDDTGNQYYEFDATLGTGGDGGQIGGALSGQSTLNSSGKAELKTVV